MTAGKCRFDGVQLEPRYASEPWNPMRVIGPSSKRRSWLSAWVCPKCGLIYDPGVLGLPDPAVVALEAEQQVAAEEGRASMKAWAEDFMENKAMEALTD